MPNRKTLKELFVDGRFTEDRAVRKEELQRHCEVSATIHSATDNSRKKRELQK